MATQSVISPKFKEQHHHFSTKEWTENYLTRNTSNKALIYFGCKARKSRRKYETRWDELPELILEKIFRRLSIRERYYASCTCKHWYQAFHLPSVWQNFTLDDSTLTRARFNYYQGWQYVLDHVRSQMCLTQVGAHFKTLTFAPMMNFFNLYEFMNMISWYSEQGDNPILHSSGIGKRIHTLKFTFPCNMDNRVKLEKLDESSVKLFGTGGRLLNAVKRLLLNLPALRHLQLVDLMLDVTEASHLLDEVAWHCMAMQTLVLINTTKTQYQLMHVGAFLNLKVLVLSPQNIGDDVLELLGCMQVRHLHIFENVFTPEYVTNTTTARKWLECRRNNPKLKVHLEMNNDTSKDIRCLLWPGAPVKSVIYDAHFTGVHLGEIMNVVELYGKELTLYAHRSLPRGFRSKKFVDRVDEPLVILARNCTKLQCLIISERISNVTILLLARACPQLQRFYVRRNAAIKKFDWDINTTSWSEEFIQWLKFTADDYQRVEAEVSQILGCKWRMLSDRQFKALDIDLYGME